MKKYILSQTWGKGRVTCYVLYTIYSKPITKELAYGNNLLKGDNYTISNHITVTELDKSEEYTAFDTMEDLTRVLDINSPNYIEFESSKPVTRYPKRKL